MVVNQVLGREHPEYGPRIAPYCAVGENCGNAATEMGLRPPAGKAGDHTTQVIVVTTTE